MPRAPHGTNDTDLTSPRSPQRVRKKSEKGARTPHITKCIIAGQTAFSTNNHERPFTRGKSELYYDI